MGFLSMFLFLIGWFSFFNKQKYLTLIVIILLSSGYFNLVDQNFVLGSLSLQHGDLALLLIFSLLPLKNKIEDHQLKGIKKALLLFLFFLSISVFYDLLIRETSFMQIFRTTRKIGYLMFFFLMSSFSWRDYQKLIQFLVIATLIHASFYISQYIFGYSFTPNLDALKTTITNESGEARYTNGPFYIIPALAICLFLYSKEKKNILMLILFFISIVLGQSRGAILSAISILLLYFFLQKKIKLNVLILVPAITYIAYTMTLSYFPVIGERFSHLYTELNLVSEMDYGNLQAFFHEGSFIFRFGLTYERFMYVLEDPIRVILGVGFVPDMDVLKPIFTLGTHSASLPTGFEQYNSVDIFFPNIITRYGIVGSLIFLYFIVKIIAFGFKNRELLWGKILFTYLFSLLFISLINETFYNGQYFILIFIIIGLVLWEKRMNNNIDILNSKVNSL